MSTHSAHPFHDAPAPGTKVAPLSTKRSGWKGQGVTGPLPGNPKVTTGLSPLRPMRTDAPVPRSRVGDQVRQLVQKGPLHLVLRDLHQRRIEFDLRIRPGSAPRGRTHPGIPANLNPICQGGERQPAAKGPRPVREDRVGSLQTHPVRDSSPPRLTKRKMHLQDRLLHGRQYLRNQPQTQDSSFPKKRSTNWSIPSLTSPAVPRRAREVAGLLAKRVLVQEDQDKSIEGRGASSNRKVD